MSDSAFKGLLITMMPTAQQKPTKPGLVPQGVSARHSTIHPPLGESLHSPIRMAKLQNSEEVLVRMRGN